MVVNKASRATELDMWNILGNYVQILFVIVGYNAQLPPVVLDDDNVNSFVRPLRMSLFQRLRLLGQPMVLLSEQYRMVGKLRTIVSTFFYSSQLTNTPRTAVEHCPIFQQIIQYFKATYQVNSPLFLLEVLGETKRDVNQSCYNISNASTALNLGLDMIAKRVIQPRQLLIMIFY